MATASLLDDQISCSVCFEVYRDPHVLKECLHTFCLSCIQQLQRNGRVECPECRTITLKRNIKRDFKIQGVIDAVNKPREDTETIHTTRRCEMCQKPGRSVKYHCKECQQFMCQECHTTHKGMTVSRNHVVKSVAQLFKDSDTKIKRLIKDVEIEQHDIISESRNIDVDIYEIQKLEKQQFLDVERYSEDIIKKVKENEKRLKKIIKDTNANVIRSLQERKRLFNKSQQEMKAKIEFLENLIKEQDIDTLTGTPENIDSDIKKSVKQIKATLPGKFCTMSCVHVQKGVKLDIKGSIEVVVDGSLTGSQSDTPGTQAILSPVKQSSFSPVQQAMVSSDHQTMLSDVCNNQYVQSDVMDLDYWPCKLVQVNNDIWCSGGGGLNDKGYIIVYKQQCQKVKTITHNELSSINGFCVTPLHVIVATDYNLHKLDHRGTYQKQIGEGRFADVCYNNTQLYALECNNMKLLVYKYIKNSWQKNGDIVLGYNEGIVSDKLCVNNGQLFISSWINRCIFIYNFQGELLQQVDQCGSVLFVCDVSDTAGDILVVDRTNNQIKLYNQHTGWKILSLTGEIQEQFNALVDKQGNVWVATLHKLFKFVKC